MNIIRVSLAIGMLTEKRWRINQLMVVHLSDLTDHWDATNAVTEIVVMIKRIMTERIAHFVWVAVYQGFK